MLSNHKITLDHSPRHRRPRLGRAASAIAVTHAPTTRAQAAEGNVTDASPTNASTVDVLAVHACITPAPHPRAPAAKVDDADEHTTNAAPGEEHGANGHTKNQDAGNHPPRGWGVRTFGWDVSQASSGGQATLTSSSAPRRPVSVANFTSLPTRVFGSGTWPFRASLSIRSPPLTYLGQYGKEGLGVVRGEHKNVARHDGHGLPALEIHTPLCLPPRQALGNRASSPPFPPVCVVCLRHGLDPGRGEPDWRRGQVQKGHEFKCDDV